MSHLHNYGADHKSLRDRVVVITGASSGFGKGAALKFADSGAHLVLAARRKRLLRDLAGECQSLGVQAIAVDADVTDRDEVRKLARRAVEEFGRIDVWVNNAGVATIGRFDEVPMEEHEQVIATNLLGTMYGSYYAVRQFREQGDGTLINVASYLGDGSSPYYSSYVASKHGVRGLGMSLRQELEANRQDAIYVCTVMPTSMDTPFFEHAANHSGHPVEPIPPVYDPEQVIDTIVDLALNPRPEVVVGRRGKVGRISGKLMPRLTERYMARQVHKLISDRKSARDSSGALFKPMESGTEIHGGWRESGSGIGKVLTAVGITAPAALALAMLARRRGRDLGKAA